jgi:sarcosine oxidase
MPRVSRRSLLLAGAGAAAALSAPKRMLAQPARDRPEIVVIGAGVFGAWTAKRLQEAGRRVTLIDAWGPAHARASSGGESRMTRGAYGPDEVYTRLALDSLGDWRALSERADLPLFHRTGVLFFFGRAEPYLEETMRVHRRLGLPSELLDNRAMSERFPQIDFAGVEAGVYEPEFGVLMARRSVQALVAEFVSAGGRYLQGAVEPPAQDGSDALESLTTIDGTLVAADRFVFACGPWLGRLFPDLLATRIFPTRQEVFFFRPPAGDPRFGPQNLPGWADFNQGDLYYGMPDLEGRGFKVAHDAHGPRVDPDSLERTPTPEELADVRAYMARRFPALAGAPLSEARVCQYENSSNGDLLIDFHPGWENVLLVGAGSGHGFKHGPAVGRYAADLLLGTLSRLEPRFSLATKSEVENRAVH